MAQLLVRNLELSVKEALQRRAQRHGRSMEEEVRLILRQAAEAEQRPPEGVGLGSQIAALFAASGLEEPPPSGTGPAPGAQAARRHHVLRRYGRCRGLVRWRDHRGADLRPHPGRRHRCEGAPAGAL